MQDRSDDTVLCKKSEIERWKLEAQLQELELLEQAIDAGYDISKHRLSRVEQISRQLKKIQRV